MLAEGFQKHMEINHGNGRHINHIHRVVPVVIAKGGEAVVDDELQE